MASSCVPLFLRTPRRRFAGAERGSRVSQVCPNIRCERVRTAEHAPRNPFQFLERSNSLAHIVERGAGVVVEHPRVIPPQREAPNMFS